MIETCSSETVEAVLKIVEGSEFDLDKKTKLQPMLEVASVKVQTCFQESWSLDNKRFTGSPVWDQAAQRLRVLLNQAQDEGVAPAEETPDDFEAQLRALVSDDDYENFAYMLRREEAHRNVTDSRLPLDDMNLQKNLVTVAVTITKLQKFAGETTNGAKTQMRLSIKAKALAAVSVAVIGAFVTHRHLLEQGRTKEFVTAAISAVGVGSVLGVGGAVANDIASEYATRIIASNQLTPDCIDAFCKAVHGVEAPQLLGGFLGGFSAGLAVDSLIFAIRKCTGNAPEETWKQHLEDAATRNGILAAIATTLAPLSGPVGWAIKASVCIWSCLCITEMQRSCRNTGTTFFAEVIKGIRAVPAYVRSMFSAAPNPVAELERVSLPVYNWDSADVEVPPELSCLICLNLVGDDGAHRNPVVYCKGHFYCRRCINEWMRERNETPFHEPLDERYFAQQRASAAWRARRTTEARMQALVLAFARKHRLQIVRSEPAAAS
mmetsp:Transcript_47045/g.110857  ORF Transcript_47045/g.110857 Transcript_47045/m.110857 type:complete len:492 (-) Transcript_47045:324-1799(-)